MSRNDPRDTSAGAAPASRIRAVSIHASNRTSAHAVGRDGTGSGLGLLGMAERVSVLGGQLTHGVTGERFELAATLPVGPG